MDRLSKVDKSLCWLFLLRRIRKINNFINWLVILLLSQYFLPLFVRINLCLVHFNRCFGLLSLCLQILVQDRRAGLPNPVQSYIPHVLSLEFFSYEDLSCSNMFQSIFGHQLVQFWISSPHLAQIEVVNVGTLHAERLKYLSTFVEASPAVHCKGNSHIFLPKFISQSVKVNLLDNLKAEFFPTILAVTFQISMHNVGNHDF